MSTQPPASRDPLSATFPFPGAAQIQARVIFAETTYYALTHEQIDTHTKLGWLTTAFISLAGFAFEVAIGAWLALAQGACGPASAATLTTTVWVAAISGIILAGTAVVLAFLKISTRRGWLTNTFRLDQSTPK